MPAIVSLLIRHRMLVLELAALAFVIAIAVVVRAYRLGEVPEILTGDEVDNLYDAYRIISGRVGMFGFDHKPSPILGLYPLAWTVQIFGDTVSDFRMFSVITSLLVVVAAYIVARQAMGAPAALLAMALLGTNLWFLHFSRTAWDNTNSALFALGACYATTRALDTSTRWRWAWWLATGIFTTLGLYGYFTGRFIFVSVFLITSIAVATRRSPWREAVVGLGVTFLVTAVLFAPMLMNIVNDWEFFNRRAEDVSVFSTRIPYEGDTNGWVIAGKNVGRNLQGLILMDGEEMERGLWYRYTPKERPPLDAATTVLFWIGLVVSLRRWNRTYAWWTFFVPLFIAEVFSRGTPDLARAVLFAPFYFLFIGLAFDQFFQSWGRVGRPLIALGAAAAVAVTAWIAVDNVSTYFDWQERDETQIARFFGIDRCEFDAWRKIAKTSAQGGGREIDVGRFEEARKELDCSRLYPHFLNRTIPTPEPTPIRIPTLTPVPTVTPAAR
jgi:4-amino-4-deoxy-L-arabinose transferase-like glycosyltransferase